MPERILIIKPSALGDVATTLPMLCDLKRAFPGAEIDWLIHPGLAALVERHDALHAVVAFDRKRLAAWWWKPAAFRLFCGLLRRLRGRRYDLVIDAQGLFRSGFLARVTGARRRIGFAHAREGAALAYTDKVRLPERGEHLAAVDRMRALLRPLKIDTSPPAEFRMPVPPLDASLAPAEPYVAVIPGARWNTKRWDADRYAQLVRQLVQSGERVALLGSPDELALCERMAAAVNRPERVTLLAGRTDLRQMIALLAEAKLVIGNDSGPLHVAVALGKRTLSIYGPTDPAFVGPYQQLENVIRHDVPCFPCRNRDCAHHSCMKGVPVELVWEKTKTLLQTHRSDSPV
jgi:heptosyltransferase-1/heptosyltransferase-2